MSQDEPMSDTNGNPLPIDPELLSAFYDAETTTDERALVEQHLDDSTGALQTLNDYDQLSQSLKELHGAIPSPELQADVMAAVSRAAVSQQSATPTPRSAAAPTRRPVLRVVAGLTGLAAAVTLLLWPKPDAPPANSVAVNDVLGINEGSEAKREIMPPLSTGARSANDGKEVGELYFSEAASATPAESVDDATTTKLAARHAEMEAQIAQAGRSTSLREIANERPLPEVGDVLGYLDRNADQLTWVAVTVVDVQKAGDQVRLLLSQNGVNAAPGSTSRESLQQSNQRVTFVVEAGWDQMEAVLVGLSDSSLIKTVEVDAPADEGVPPELQNYATSRYEEYNLADTNRSVDEVRRRVKDRNGVLGGRGAVGGAPAVRDGQPPAIPAVQLQANVSDQDLERIAKRRSVEKPSPSGVHSDPEAVGPPQTKAVELDTISAKPRAKVLIILQTE